MVALFQVGSSDFGSLARTRKRNCNIAKLRKNNLVAWLQRLRTLSTLRQRQAAFPCGMSVWHSRPKVLQYLSIPLFALNCFQKTSPNIAQIQHLSSPDIKSAKKDAAEVCFAAARLIGAGKVGVTLALQPKSDGLQPLLERGK